MVSKHEETSETDGLLSGSKIDPNHFIVNQYFCGIIPYSWVLIPSQGENAVIVKNSADKTIYLLLNSMIGSGILAQAYVFSKAGWISASIEYLIIGYLTYTGAELLIKAADKLNRNIHTYADLCEIALGIYGKPFLELSITINNFGCLLSYLIIIGSLLRSILIRFLSPSIWLTNSSFLIIVIVYTIIFPLCLIRQFGHLVIVSTISVMAITGVVLLVSIGGPIISYSNNHNSNHYYTLRKGSFTGSIDTIGSVIFAFGYASVVFHSYNVMIPKQPDVFNHVAFSATIIGATLCFLIGIIGDWSFENSTKTDILENFNGILGIIFKCIVIIHLILYIPGDYVVMRSSFMNLFGKDILMESNLTYVLITFLSFSVITILVCIILSHESSSTSLAIVLDLTGGVSGSIVNFLAPGLIARKILWDNTESFGIQIRIISLLLLGSIIPFLVLYSTIATNL